MLSWPMRSSRLLLFGLARLRFVAEREKQGPVYNSGIPQNAGVNSNSLAKLTSC